MKAAQVIMTAGANLFLHEIERQLVTVVKIARYMTTFPKTSAFASLEADIKGIASSSFV